MELVEIICEHRRLTIKPETLLWVKGAQRRPRRLCTKAGEWFYLFQEKGVVCCAKYYWEVKPWGEKNSTWIWRSWQVVLVARGMEAKLECTERMMRVKEESEKVGLKLTFRKLRSWHQVPSLSGKWMGKQWKQWQTILGGSKITADGGCSHEIKRRLFLGRKVVTNLDSILKSRDITLPTKVRLVKAWFFQ